MGVSEVSQALGSFSVNLDMTKLPLDVLNSLDYFGHIAVSTGRPDVRVSGDSLLKSARYVGVLRSVNHTDKIHTLSGSGMSFWLGDENGGGSVITTPVTLTASSFTAAVAALLPTSGAVTSGSVTSVTGTYTQAVQYMSCRAAITALCSVFSQTSGSVVDWRVNGDGTLDAGLVSAHWVTTPQCAIIRKQSGLDLSVRAFPGETTFAEDVTSFATEVILYANNSTGGAAALADVSLAGGLNPYRDIHGNTFKSTKLMTATATDAGSATAVATSQLNQFASTNDQVSFNTSEYDLKGDCQVGDYVLDPDSGLVDTTQQVVFQGQIMNPVVARVTELNWPVVQGMSVAYRSATGVWADLTDYVSFESGTTTVRVGGVNRPLVAAGGGTISPGTHQYLRHRSFRLSTKARTVASPRLRCK